MRFQNLDYQALYESVSEYTRRFIRFIMVGGNEQDFLNCKKNLDQLLRELRRRRNSGGNNHDLEEQLRQLTNLLNNKVVLN